MPEEFADLIQPDLIRREDKASVRAQTAFSTG